MRDDDEEREMRGWLWRVLAAVISVVVVSEYVLLAAGTLIVRAVFRMAGDARRGLLPDRGRRRHGARARVEATSG
jgi:hypothetical protein